MYWNLPFFASLSLDKRNISIREFRDFPFNISGTKAILNEIIGNYFIDFNVCKEQVDYIVHHYIIQCVFFKDLLRYLIKIPKKILISDHDGGFHGPILSYAEKHNIKIFILPHSVISQDFLFPNKNVVFLNYPYQIANDYNLDGDVLPKIKIFPYEIRIDGLNERLKYLKYRLHQKSHHWERKLNCGILLNNYNFMDASLHINYTNYINELKNLLVFFNENNEKIDLKIRPRGNFIEYELLKECQIKNLNYESFKLFYKNIDICIMFGEPTSGIIEVLDYACPVIQIKDPTYHKNVPFDISHKFYNESVIPSKTSYEVQKMLKNFCDDHYKLFKFTIDMIENYSKLFFENTQSLQDILT